ncbi:hypothetical protein BH10ACI1_BH10ACI1_04310 [soil metagenome]
MRKILFLIILFLILCCIGNAQNLNCKITNNGCGKIKIGVSQKKVEKFLGKPEKTNIISWKSTDDFYFSDYYSKGISIMFLSKSKSIYGLFFYNNDSSGKEYKVFNSGLTKKGIDWKSTPDDVIKAYGKPKDDFNGTEYNENWRRIVYPRMDFRFENNTLVRIGVFVKEKKEKVQPI